MSQERHEMGRDKVYNAAAYFPMGPLKVPDTTTHRSSLGHLGRWCHLWLQQWTKALIIIQSGETARGKTTSVQAEMNSDHPEGHLILSSSSNF